MVRLVQRYAVFFTKINILLRIKVLNLKLNHVP